MRLVRLDLIAFGPFTQTKLDLAAPEHGVHVVFGPNEAGKSTTLRAVTALLYGFPQRTQDDHVHQPKELRVGGLLDDERGGMLEVVRRKGTKNTLLDPSGKQIDEALLRRILGNVGEEQFLTMFGLDHQRLRQGAQDLLEGKGDLAESLFAASLGGSGLHDLRERLRDEHLALFSPQAWTKPLNKGIKEFQEAQKKVRNAALEEEAWRAQERGIDEARADKARLDEEWRELKTQLSRAERRKLVLPLLDRRRALEARRKALGEVRILPASAKREREDALRAMSQASSDMDTLHRDIERLDEQRSTLSVPESLVADADAVADIQARLGNCMRGQRELPTLILECNAVEDEARSLLRRIDRNATLEDVERLRIDGAAHARVRALALKPSALEEKVRQSSQALDQAEPARREIDERLARLPPPIDIEDLKRALARAQRLGNVDERLERLRTETARLERLATEKVAVLGSWSGPLDALSKLVLPGQETVERFSREWTKANETLSRLSERANDLKQRLRDRKREIDALQRAGDIPTEAQLVDARARRDEAYAALRGGYKAGDAKSKSLATAFETAMHTTDELADRLRREATRVATLANLESECESTNSELEALTKEREDLDRERAAASDAWTALWKPSGIEPLSPAEMMGWLHRFRAAEALAEQYRTSRTELATLEKQIADHRGELDALLARCSETRSTKASKRPIEASLADLVDRATAVRDDAESDKRRREELEESAFRLSRQIDQLTRERESHRQELAGWRTAWREAIEPLPLPHDASPEQANVLLDELAELFRCVDQAKKQRRRIAALERESETFATDVAALARRHAPELEQLSAVACAEQLVKRYHEGQTHRATREQIDRQLEEKRRELGRAKKRADEGRATLDRLSRDAGATNVAELERAEEASEQAREIDQKLREIEQSLLDAGQTGSLDRLAAELAGIDADALEASIVELEARLEEMERKRDARMRDVVNIELGLEQMRSGKADAAEAAMEAQAILAALRTNVDRYVRVRLAAALLDREMEAYRADHQGPVLLRASELFKRLTLGAYTGLKSGFGSKDEPILHCVRGDGRQVEVDGLSDGTRDQLYFALRLATLERHAEEQNNMPLIVDDVLIHFDDERAGAALEVLAEMSRKTQVLFFTHHARLLELARKAVPPTLLGEHRLA